MKVTGTIGKSIIDSPSTDEFHAMLFFELLDLLQIQRIVSQRLSRQSHDPDTCKRCHTNPRQDDSISRSDPFYRSAHSACSKTIEIRSDFFFSILSFTIFSVVATSHIRQSPSIKNSSILKINKENENFRSLRVSMWTILFVFFFLLEISSSNVIRMPQ